MFDRDDSMNNLLEVKRDSDSCLSCSVSGSLDESLTSFYGGVWDVVSLSLLERKVFDSEGRLWDLMTIRGRGPPSLGYWELHRILVDLDLIKLPLSLGRVRIFWISFCTSMNSKLAHVSYLEQTDIFKSYKVVAGDFTVLLSCLLCYAFADKIPKTATLVDAIHRYLTRRVDSDYFRNVYRDYLLDPSRIISRSEIAPKSPIRAVSFAKLRHAQTEEVVRYLRISRKPRSRFSFV